MPHDPSDFKRDLLQRERERESGHDYLQYHRRRFAYVLDLAKRLVPNRDARVLDVGPSQLSRALAEHYHEVTTLGFQPGGWGHDRSASEREPTRHVDFDLNEVIDGRVPSIEGGFDLVVFAETIEHLHAAPELVMRMLRNLLAVGGLLVCQTPNAAALHKRVKLAIGSHPYERIRIDERNPGHFREYTKTELIEIARTAGLDLVRHEYADYFGPPDAGGVVSKLGFAAYRVVAAIAPTLRRGQTLVARRPA